MWLWDFFVSEFLSWVFFAVLAVIMPIIVAYLGRMKKSWSKPYTLMALMFTVACGLVIYNYIPMEWHTGSGRIERTLHSWAFKSGFTVSDNSQKLARFSLVLTDKSNVKVVVSNLKKDDQYRILVNAKVDIAKEQQVSLEKMSPEKKLQFISHIKLELIKYGIGYNLKAFDPSFQNIILSDVFVYDESLTRTAFLKELKFVRAAEFLFIELLQAKIREIEQT